MNKSLIFLFALLLSATAKVLAVCAISGPSMVCVGSNITLTGVACSGSATWSSTAPLTASVNAFGVVTGVAVGTATISYSDGTPFGTGTKVVTVNNTAPAPITGASSVCIGSYAPLTETVTGGMWNHTAPYGVISGAGVVFGVSAGVVTFTYSTGCLPNATHTMTVEPTPLIGGPTTVCESSTIGLTASPSGGAWSTSSGFAWVDAITGDVTGLLAGPAVITYTTAAGCSATYAISVLPAPSAITGASELCSGTIAVYTDAVGAGTWSSSPASAGVIDAVGNFTGGTAGTADITYTLSSGCYVTVPVLVDAVPVISGTPTVCVGSTTTLSATGTGIWDPGSGFTAWVDAAGIVSGVSAGTVDITFTDGTTACFSTVTITVNALPTISGITTICMGSTTALTASGTGTWAPGSDPVAWVDAAGVVTGVAAGTSDITFTDGTTGCSSTITITVTGYTIQTWNGSADDDWNNATNWTCGHIPLVTEDVLIPASTPHDPSLAYGVPLMGYAHNLTIGAATLSIGSSGYQLWVAGDLTINGGNLFMDATTTSYLAGNLENQGSITGDGFLYMNGASAQTIKSTGTGAAMKTISNLIAGNTSGISIINTSGYDPIGITGSLTLGGSVVFTTNDYLVLCSSASGTARIAAIPSSSSIAGKVTSQQYIPGGHRAWRFLGHPFDASLTGGLTQIESGVDISGPSPSTHCFVASSTNAPTAYYYKTSSSNAMLASDPGWIAYSTACGGGGATTEMGRYQGIRVLIRGALGQGLGTGSYTPSATTFQWSGYVNQGDQHVPVATTTATATSTSSFSNFSIPSGGYTDYSQTYQLLANPYPSPVDLSSVLDRNYTGGYGAGYSNTVHGTTASLLYTPYFWVYQPDMGSLGQYLPQSFHGTSYYIPAHSSFEVRMNPLYSGGLSSVLDFYESDKVSATTYTGSNELLRDAAQFTVINVMGPENRLYDIVKLRFTDDATANEDPEVDAGKRMGFGYNCFTVSKDRHPLTFDYRPFNEGEAITLGMNGTDNAHLTIKVPSVVVPDGKSLYLHDRLLNRYELVTAGMEYGFDFDASSTTQGDRFELAMKPSAFTNANSGGDFIVRVSPNPATNDVTVAFSGAATESTTVSLLSVTGSVLQTQNAGVQTSGKVSFSLNTLPQGIYMVEVTCGKNKSVQKLVKE